PIWPASTCGNCERFQYPRPPSNSRFDLTKNWQRFVMLPDAKVSQPVWRTISSTPSPSEHSSVSYNSGPMLGRNSSVSPVSPTRSYSRVCLAPEPHVAPAEPERAPPRKTHQGPGLLRGSDENRRPDHDGVRV